MTERGTQDRAGADRLREDRNVYLDNCVASVVTLLGIAEERREREVIRLRALVDGHLGQLAERAAESQAEGSPSSVRGPAAMRPRSKTR